MLYLQKLTLLFFKIYRAYRTFFWDFWKETFSKSIYVIDSYFINFFLFLNIQFETNFG